MSRITSLLLLLLLPLAAWSQEFTGRVVRVIDGATLVVLSATNTHYKIRLAGIDCPEHKQAWSTKAKQALSDYVFDHQVTVDWHKRDRYKRYRGKGAGRPPGRKPGLGPGRHVLVVSKVRE